MKQITKFLNSNNKKIVNSLFEAQNIKTDCMIPVEDYVINFGSQKHIRYGNFYAVAAHSIFYKRIFQFLDSKSRHCFTIFIPKEDSKFKAMVEFTSEFYENEKELGITVSDFFNRNFNTKNCELAEVVLKSKNIIVAGYSN